MFARKGVFSSIGRAGAAATVVAMALTAVQPSTAFAGSASSAKGVTASTGTGDVESSTRNAITANELAGVADLMTLDAIRRLRPSWLRSRPTWRAR